MRNWNEIFLITKLDHVIRLNALYALSANVGVGSCLCAWQKYAQVEGSKFKGLESGAAHAAPNILLPTSIVYYQSFEKVIAKMLSSNKVPQIQVFIEQSDLLQDSQPS